MAKIERYICDIQSCEKKADKKGEPVMVIFHTEQTEGRSTTPYFTIEDLDLCKEHWLKMFKEDRHIHGRGAQGYNEYYFKKREE